MEMNLNIRSRSSLSGDFMNTDEEAAWLAEKLLSLAPAEGEPVKVTVNVLGSEVGGGLGRAREMAVASVDASGKVTDWRVEEVGWDVLHDQDPEGSHHGRIVTFMRENQINAVVAGHAGPPMVNTLVKLGVFPVLGLTGDAREAAAAAATRYREVIKGQAA
ncbi:MAG: NifB/NifX family molybdenum-iron cluster-binding protein [Mobiluncus sp.]|uniref:NifB/NifX family molybdenum-iron cluster-binding protein n=1 Tax=Mobiluncus sp. TaxID=47293 RepID=UPI002586C4DB|nr:NifB/NifX family molybdenum-iron cluster-binding protein [Mobiluncus sp.]MCI6585085.1 NifB/NifX family molybdenum-iron cluster-binding protein [Mobiluncus sp.]